VKPSSPLLFTCPCAVAAASVFGQHFPSRPVKIVRPHLARGRQQMPSRADRRPPLRVRASLFIARTSRARTRSSRRVRGEIGARRQHPSRVGCIVVRHQPALYRNMAYDGLRGFTPIPCRALPWVVAVHPSVPAGPSRSSSPTAAPTRGRLPTAPSGLGSSAHISVDYLKKLLASTSCTFLQGRGPAVTDLLGGQIHIDLWSRRSWSSPTRAPASCASSAAATRERHRPPGPACPR